MEKKKVLSVRAAVCDIRGLREETLAGYERVRLDCGVVLTSPESRELLGRSGAEVKAANVLDIDGDVKVSSVNGRAEITPAQTAPPCRIYLIVNGVLDIAPGSEDQLRHYAGITVNGSVACPKSMVSLLAGTVVNGTVAAYPDGCIRLKKTALLDRTFPLRAREGALYYAAGRIAALDPAIDFARLAAKNVRFSTPRLLVAEGLAEAAVPLFDEEAEITVLPDGCAFLNDDASLDEALLRRTGGKLYLRGSLRVGAESAPLLERFTFLRVTGDVLAARGAAEAVEASCAQYQRLQMVGGVLLSGRTVLTVGRELLERAEDGVSIADCVDVTVEEDVPPELLRERLVSVTGCVNVACTEEQRTAIEHVAEDVVNLGRPERAEAQEDGDLVRISSAFYTL